MKFLKQSLTRVFFLLAALSAPALHAQLANHASFLTNNHGAIDFHFGNRISTGFGYGSICPHNVENEKVTRMM
jgi:hypothetical protein